jgi:6-phosphogluconolactonase
MSGELVLLEDPQTVATHVAGWLAERIAAASGIFRVSLSGGSTPKAMFDILASPEHAKIDWSHVHLFWGDERFVPPDHPDSNYGMTRARLLSKITIPPGNIHPIPSDGTPADAALRYEKLLQAEYGADHLLPERPLFDVNFLGLGEDGHTASLIPDEPVLDERTRWVAEVSHGRPEVRITLTYPPLESSATVAFLVTGAGKREIMARARAGDMALPAARLHPQGALIWFADKAAAGA